MNAIELYNEGLMKARAGQFDEAAELLREAIAKNPSHVNSHNVLGKVLARTGSFKEARKCWETALTIDPLNRTAWACLQALEKRTGRRIVWSVAFAAVFVAAFVVLVSTNQGVRKIHTELSALVALLHERLLSSADLGSEADSTETISPTDGVYPPDGVRPPPASEHIASTEAPSDSALIRVPAPTAPTPSWKSEVQAAYEAALWDYERRKFTRAMSKFREVRNVSHWHDLKDNAQYWIGECWYAKGDYERALTEFEKVKALYPRENKVLHARIKVAYCYYRLGEDGKAMDLVTRLQREPDKGACADQAIRKLLRRIGSTRRKRSS